MIITHPKQIQNPKLFNAMFPRNKIMRGFRVKVPRSARKVYIPRKHHYVPKVYTEEKDYNRLNKLHDSLEPCIVYRGVNGWEPHSCPYHPLVIIEEK